MTRHVLIDEIKKLPPEQRLELIDEIYDTLNSRDSLTPGQEIELQRRVELYRDRPDQWTPLEQVEAELDQLLKKTK